MYYSSILITNYYREQTDLILKTIIDTNINLNISIFCEKQDTYKTIKDLTYHIGNVGVDLKINNQNRQDIDIAAFTYNDAKYIRKELQVNNESLYFLYIYITTFSTNLKELDYFVNKLEGLLQSKGMQTRKAYFRQEQAYLSVLPIMKNDNDLKNVSRRNILTSGLVSTYPFISSAIFDENGIFIGTNIYNNSLVFVDRYDSTKYKNANICIFDPDREYGELCKNLNGTLIKMGPGSNTFINIFDIRENSLEDGETGYLANKISKLIGFFNLIFGDINEEEKAILEEKLIELYRRKGITFDDNSLHKIEKNKVNIKPCFKETFDMPLLEDLCNLLGEDEKTKVFKIKLIPFVKGSLSFFNNYTNLKMDDKLVVADIYEMGEENLKYAMYVFVDYFWDRIKKDRNVKKAIYLDEIWRLIGVTSNKEVASFIYKIFKTIRKFGGSSVAITQDISDLFSLDEGIYGKSILNNSEIKTFFALEEENILLLSKYTNLSEKEKIEIKSLKRGESLMFVGNEHILTRIDAAEFEKNIIEKRNDVNNEKNNNSISKSNVK